MEPMKNSKITICMDFLSNLDSTGLTLSNILRLSLSTAKERSPVALEGVAVSFC